MTDADRDASFVTTIRVERGPDDAFRGITDARGWWSQEIEGATDEVGAEFDYHFKDVHRCRIRVTELVPGRKVAWLVLDNHFDFVQNQSEWKGTEIVFDIAEKDGGTEVVFTHSGLLPQFECYDVCSNAWGGYIGGSLRNLIDSGRGAPNPKADGEAPEHQEAAGASRAAHRIGTSSSPQFDDAAQG
jgi:hypothetical protein